MVFRPPLAPGQTFPKLSGSFEERASYRNPEQDGAWEGPQRLLNELLYPEGVAKPFPKLKVADLVAPYMNIEPGVNRAPRFDAFVKGLRACA